MSPRICVQAEDFDGAAEIARLERAGGGAVAGFTGLVRGDGGLVTLELEHYPAMTQTALSALAKSIARRWPLAGLTLIHRFGKLVPGDRIVFVGAASAHRHEAIAAMHFAIDWLKTDAPFWKCETFSDGRQRWIDASRADAERRDRWS